MDVADRWDTKKTWCTLGGSLSSLLSCKLLSLGALYPVQKHIQTQRKKEYTHEDCISLSSSLNGINKRMRMKSVLLYSMFCVVEFSTVWEISDVEVYTPDRASTSIVLPTAASPFFSSRRDTSTCATSSRVIRPTARSPWLNNGLKSVRLIDCNQSIQSFTS